MAGKMDKQPAPPLPMSVEEDKKKKKQARATPPLPGAVTLVSLWALVNACLPALAVALAFTLSAYNLYNKLPSWLYQRIELTDAEAARGISLLLGYIGCGVPQAAAAAAALALLLAGGRRRIRRALAYLALAVTVAGHFMFVGIVSVILAADPGHLFTWINGAVVIFLCAAVDLFCFLDMLLGED